MADPNQTLKKLLTQLIKESKRDRAAIAAAMSRHTGCRVSTRMLFDWSASRKQARLPAAFVEAFCKALGDDRLQRHIMGERLRRALAVGEAVLEARPKRKKP